MRLRLLAALWLAWLAGCSAPPPAASSALEQTAERGPFKLVLRATPPQLTFGDRLTLSAELFAPADATIRFTEPPAATPAKPPPLADGAEAPPDPWRDFLLVSATLAQPRAGADGESVHGVTWTLEPVRSGDLTLPALRAAYESTGGRGELEAAEMVLKVASVLAAEETPATPRDITGLLSAPAKRWTWREWSITACLVAAGALLAWLAARAIRSRAARPVPPPAAEVIALQALAALEGQDWNTAERWREYYYRVTEILRVYVESKFGLRAPEMTTEEFLQRLAREAHSVPLDAGALRDFLLACDLVKYAALQPRRDDADSALSTARAFVMSSAAAAERSRAAAQAPLESERAA